jgi:class 3 adenylate cyclase
VEELELGRQVKKMATVMFCDLKSVSASKTLSLEENFNYINSYLKVVAPLIARYDGFVDKHFGDGMLAVFARPQSAIECANAVLRAIEIKNKNQKDLPAIDARISINTGEVVFGIGTEEENKMPTIVSNVVSLVSKMDEINLYIGTKLLISKQTINNIPENFHFNYRYTGELSLDDDKTLSLFESLENYPKNRREKLKKYKNKFEEGVHFYNEKDYQKAKESFAYVLRFVPDDKPTYVYFNKSVEKLKEAA